VYVCEVNNNNNNNNNLLRMNKTAQELVRGQQVEWVRPDDLVDQALQKMAKHDLTALPVVEPSTESAQGTIKGFVDVLDLVRAAPTDYLSIFSSDSTLVTCTGLFLACQHHRWRFWRPWALGS
jgi:CBS-domain-containing membrane protein